MLHPCKGERFSTVAIDVGVDTCHDSLSSCFLVTGCSVYLSGKEQILYILRFQRMFQLGGVKEVVFDGIARAVDDEVSERRYLFNAAIWMFMGNEEENPFK